MEVSPMWLSSPAENKKNSFQRVELTTKCIDRKEQKWAICIPEIFYKFHRFLDNSIQFPRKDFSSVENLSKF